MYPSNEEANQEKEYTTCRQERILHRRRAKNQKGSWLSRARKQLVQKGPGEEGFQGRGERTGLSYLMGFTTWKEFSNIFWSV